MTWADNFTVADAEAAIKPDILRSDVRRRKAMSSAKRLAVACVSIAALGGVLALLPGATVNLVAASSEPAEARGGGGGAGGAGAGAGGGGSVSPISGWPGFAQGAWVPWQPRGMGYGYGMVASIPVPTARPVTHKKHRTIVHHQAIKKQSLSLQDVAAR